MLNTSNQTTHLNQIDEDGGLTVDVKNISTILQKLQNLNIVAFPFNTHGVKKPKSIRLANPVYNKNYYFTPREQETKAERQNLDKKEKKGLGVREYFSLNMNKKNQTYFLENIAIRLDNYIVVDLDAHKVDPKDAMSQKEVEKALGIQLPKPFQIGRVYDDNIRMPDLSPNNKHWIFRLPYDIDLTKYNQGNVNFHNLHKNIDIIMGPNKMLFLKHFKEVYLDELENAPIAPPELLKLMEKLNENHSTSPKAQNDVDIQYIIDAANYIKNREDFELWLNVGMAFHDLDPSDNGRNIWDKWSQSASNYEADAIIRHWNSFSHDKPNKITYKTILHYAKKDGFTGDKPLLESYDDIVACISFCKNNKQLTNVLSSTHMATLTAVDYENILTLAETKSNSFIKEFVFKQGVLRQYFKAKIKKPDNVKIIELNNKFYMSVIEGNPPSSYVEYDTNTLYLTLLKLKYIPQLKDARKNIIEFLTQNEWDFISAGHSTYDPSTRALIVEENGIPAVNLYYFVQEPEPAAPINERQQKALELLKLHVLMICNENEDSYNVLTSWLASVVQNKKSKMGWVPIISGEYGLGKSLIIQIMGKILGKNCKHIQGEEFLTRFNSWANKTCFLGCEEFDTKGKTKTQAYNKLKSLITDPKMTIEEKFENKREIDNTIDLIIMTNKIDPIRVPKQDTRRFWVHYIKYENKEELETYVVKNSKIVEIIKYFNMPVEIESYFHILLYISMPEASRAYYDYLMNYTPLEAIRKERGNAPKLQNWLASMSSSSISDEEQIIIEKIEEIIETNPNCYVNKYIVCTSVLKDMLDIDSDINGINTYTITSLGKILKDKMGFKYTIDKLKINNKIVRGRFRHHDMYHVFISAKDKPKCRNEINKFFSENFCGFERGQNTFKQNNVTTNIDDKWNFLKIKVFHLSKC